MQPETGGPRAGASAVLVRQTLTDPSVEVDFGADLLDYDDAVVADLSDYLDDGRVSRSNYADVHGTCDIALRKKLAWGLDRVRLWQTLRSPRVGITYKFFLGVYLLATPNSYAGESEVVYDVTGYDKLHLLQGTIGDTWVCRKGANVLDEVRRVIAASGVGGKVYLDPTRADAVLERDLVWPLIPANDGAQAEGEDATQDSASFLTVANRLLKSIGYRGLWADEVGTLRSEPYVNPKDRLPEWTFDADDELTGIVGEDRGLQEDAWKAPNRWRFIRTNLDVPPVEGAGIYTVVNESDGPTSRAALRRTVTKVVKLEAQSQADLVSQGDAIVTADRALSGLVTLELNGPFPLLGHFDQVAYTDSGLGGERRSQVRSWALPLGGENPSLELEDI